MIIKEYFKIALTLPRLPLKIVVLLCGLLYFVTNTSAQQVYPVSASSQVLPPNSLYLSDYYAPGANLWQINLNFLDFAEPSREVYLKISIESNSVTLNTVPNTYPLDGVFTLIPGQSQLISGGLLAPYFNSQFMLASGISWTQIQQNGRLPEGFYTFCIEVIDVYSGEVLSVKTCSSAWLRLNDQPIINTPFCGNVINTTVPLNIPIQWQSNNLLSPNSAYSTEYQVNVFEVTDLTVSPINAAGNGNIIPVFQSLWNNQTSFLYDISAPSLEIGKCYAFNIQARDVSGRDLFKNNGFSEYCWFYYGYPDGGILPLIQPLDSASFAKFQQQYFKWGGSSNFLPSQPIEYQLTIVEVDTNEYAADAMNNNTPWHQEVFPVNYAGTGLDFELSKQQKPFVKGQRYAWKVAANSNTQVVAESPIYTFLGPPLVDVFYVNNHEVEVISLASNDLTSLSGVGRVKLNVDGTETALLNFNDISLVNYGGVFFLSSGALHGAVEDADSITYDLTPLIAENSTASASFTEVRLSNTFDLDVKGRVSWDFPLIVNSDEAPVWVSDYGWLEYTNYQFNGLVTGIEEASYTLLEPYGFNFILSESSEIQLSNNSYSVNLNGNLEVPDFVAGFADDLRVKYLFEDQNQPFYIQDNKTHYRSNLLPVGQMNIKIEPATYVLDLSFDNSPGKFQDTPDWMGVYLSTYNLNFKTTGYSFDALQFTQDVSKLVTLSEQDSSRAWITSNGLSFLAEEAFTSNQGLTYNTFPGQMDSARIEVENSALTNSYMTGNIKIPFLSASHEFPFTVPMTIYGYNQGYLQESIDSTSYIFNQGAGDNEIYITVNRAVFEDNQKLVMNIGMDWPGMEISIDDADGFMIWGNYNIGFGNPNGVLALQIEQEGHVGDYDILIRNIGMGRDANLYSIGLNGDMQMGEDVAGDDGAPVFNAYSIYESPLIPENYQPGTAYNFGDPNSLGSYSTDENGYGGPTFGDTTNSNLAFAMNIFGDALAATNTTPDYESGSDSDSIPLPGGPQVEYEDGLTPSEILQKVVVFIDLVKPFMPDSLKLKATDLKQKLETLQASELYAIYLEIEENGFDLQKILKAQVDKIIVSINTKIENGIDKLNRKIENTILNPVDTLVGKANKLIERIIDEVAEQIIESLGDNNLTVALDSAATVAKIQITTSISASIHNSVKTNVTDKITSFIDTVFKDQVTAFIKEEVSHLGYALIDQNMDSISFDSIFAHSETLLNNIIDDIVSSFKAVSMSGVKSTCKNIVDDAVDGIDWPQIGEDIGDAFLASFADQLTGDVLGAISGFFGDTSNTIVANFQENFKFDFTNMGDKLANGDIEGIVKFDPTKIKISTKVVDLEGMIKHRQDSIWGDCWEAYLSANIHKPKEISAYMRYINGKIDNSVDKYNYWFLEVAIDKGLNIPISAVILDGIGGKVFKHMVYKREPGQVKGVYLPTDTVKFGLGVALWIIDGASMGTTLKLKVEAEVQIMEDDFTMEIRGDVSVKNKENTKESAKEASLANGVGYIGYSSITKQLLGQFDVTVNASPLVCGGGSMGINVEPGYWNVYVGKKTDPIVIKLLCRNILTVNSWFDISSTALAIGIESQYDFSGQTPWFKVGTRYWQPYASFGWHFLTELDMQFKPDFVINNAQILMHVYSSLGVNWENRTLETSGNINLLDVELLGNVQYSQNTSSARFQGQLAGHVTVLTVGIGFDISIDKSL